MRREETETQPRLDLGVVLLASAGAALFQFLGNANKGYIDTSSLFYWWGYQWANPASETEHGWLILGLSIWMCWRNLRASPGSTSVVQGAVPGNSPWPGALALVGALGLHALGFAVQQSRISILALLVFAWAILRIAGGRRWGAAALFPLAFLVFAIPLNVLDSVGFWLRLWVIKASTMIAHGAGIAVVQSGTQLLAPDGRYQYDVAAACSGVRSLMALAALSLLLGYLNFSTWWKRATIFLLCFPLVYLGNVARITGIIFAAQWGGQVWGERAHDVMGLGVFAIVLGGAMAATAGLARLFPERSEPVSPPPRSRVSRGIPSFSLSIAGDGRAAGMKWIPFAFVGLIALEMAFLHRLVTHPPVGSAGIILAADGRNPAEFPTFLGAKWIGWQSDVTSVEREILPPDTGFSRRLYVPSGETAQAVFISIVLSGVDRTSIHRPELCLMGQGWTLLDEANHRFSYPGSATSSFPATLLRTRREIVTAAGRQVSPDLVAYWFVNSEQVVASHWERLALDAWSRLFRRRSDRWAYVLVQTSARDGEPAALARMQAVLDQVLPVFQPPFR